MTEYRARPLHWSRKGLQSVVADSSSDQRAFKNVPWGKPMMWIFLVSDTFIFGSFLISYMTVRMSTTVPWPNPSEVFSLTMFGQNMPLILIAIMTFVLISSSGTMALAVNYGYRKDRKTTFWLLLATAVLGATFVGMQAFEWTKLILEGVRPWGNPLGRGAVRLGVLHDHRLPRHARDDRRDLPGHRRRQGLRGDLDHQRPGFLTGRDAATTRSSRRWACTGTSSIWCGYSSSRSSISGRPSGTGAHVAQDITHPTTMARTRRPQAQARGPAAPARDLLQDLGRCCSCSASPRTWWTTSTSRGCCGGR